MCIVINHNYRRQRTATDTGDSVQCEKAVFGRFSDFDTQFIFDGISDQFSSGHMTGGTGTGSYDILPHGPQPELAVKCNYTEDFGFRDSRDCGDVIYRSSRNVTEVVLSGLKKRNELSGGPVVAPEIVSEFLFHIPLLSLFKPS